jgi:hypothetical protein
MDMLMTDGGILGIDKPEDPITAEPSGPPPPKFYGLHYFWDGTHLRVRPANRDKGQWSSEEVIREGWYVSADYSTDPPQVVLTKHPTSDSRWSFIAESMPRRMRYYVKNDNERGKDAWLDMVDTGKKYSAGTPGVGYRPVRVFRAILSFGNKKLFRVLDIEADGGK